MDVTVKVTEGEEKTCGASPNGGCNARFGLLALAVLPMIMRRRS